MRGAALALAAAVGLLAGCNPHADECESICRQFVVGCEFTAWPTAEQCRAGCEEDMYRRDDAADVFACYEAAVAPPSRIEAGARVDAAVDRGFFAEEIAAGTWDREATIDAAVEAGTCDLFAVVQCKVEAVQVRPDPPLLP